MPDSNFDIDCMGALIDLLVLCRLVLSSNQSKVYSRADDEWTNEESGRCEPKGAARED